jgi:hypothetical protein
MRNQYYPPLPSFFRGKRGAPEMAISNEPSTETRAITSRFRRIFLFVVLPAVIAGFFSILPKLYDVLIKERAALSYQLVSGPAIPLQDGFRRIFAIVLQNTGKVPLTHINMEIRTRSGKIESMVAEKSLLHPIILEDTSTMTVARMLPNERVNLSVMTRSNLSEPEIDIQARSDETVAVAQNINERTDSNIYIAVAGALLSAISVAVMSVSFSIALRRGRGRISEIMRSDKPDIITFIVGISGVIPMSESILMTEHEMTYARLADLFLFTGLKGDEEVRRKCAAGLRVLFVINNIAERSLLKAKQNLGLLGADITDNEFKNPRDRAGSIGEVETRRKIVEEFQNWAGMSRDDVKVG